MILISIFTKFEILTVELFINFGINFLVGDDCIKVELFFECHKNLKKYAS